MDFPKRMEMAVMNTYSKKKEEHRGTSTNGERGIVDCMVCSLKFEGKASLLAEQTLTDTIEQ